MPRQAIEAAGRFWTNQGRIVTNGPFTLAERRPRDLVRVVRNSNYYDAEHVALDEIRFVPFPDVSMLPHYYKAGEAQSTASVDWAMMSGLHVKRDCRTHRMFGVRFPTFNTGKPPFDNPLVRYAFNMSVDKSGIARWKGMGQAPARTLVPPIETYKPPTGVLSSDS